MATAWVAGGSGLVGGELLRQLLADRYFDRVVSIGRRKLPIDHPKLVQVQSEFTGPMQLGDVPHPDVAFCCLGTTLKKAGFVKAAYRMVDHDSVLVFAETARENGAPVFIHVTALGADAHSRVFYNALKGETEQDVAQLGFDSVYSIRPSLLDGHRTERRLGERFALVAARFLGPLLGRFRPTPVVAVARSMLAAARSRIPGTHSIEPEEILSSFADH